MDGMTAHRLTDAEIRRTAHKRIEQWRGHYLTTRDKNEMCISCKNEETTVIRDPVLVAKFKQVLNEPKVVICECDFCGAVHSCYG